MDFDLNNNFFSKAGVPIHRLSESTHVGALNKACKMMKFKKKLNSFRSNVQGLCEPAIFGILPWANVMCNWAQILIHGRH